MLDKTKKNTQKKKEKQGYFPPVKI